MSEKLTPPISSQEIRHRSPFTLVDVGIVFSFVILVLLLFYFKIFDFGFLIWNEKIDYSIRIFHVFLLQEALFLVPVVVLMIVRYRSSCIQGCGFVSFRLPKAIMSIVWWYVVYIILAYSIAFISQWLHIQIPGFGEGRSILPLFGQDKSTPLVLILAVLCIAPIVEEMFFRGFLFRTLLKKSSYLIASIVTAFVFATIHLDFGAFIPRFILGFILNQIVWENNRSIIPAIMFHMMNNAIALLFLLMM